MTPKTPTGNGDDSKANDITTLCHMVMISEGFKVDNEKLAPILGIAYAKNVPRKINSIVNQYGFEFKNGKMNLTDSDATTPATPKIPKATNKNDEPTTPTTKKRPNSKKKDGNTPKTPKGSKKLKLTVTTEEDEPMPGDAIKTEADKAEAE